MFSFNRKIASGFLKISFGPMNPLLALFIDNIAIYVDNAADAPLESLNCLPARIAR